MGKCSNCNSNEAFLRAELRLAYPRVTGVEYTETAGNTMTSELNKATLTTLSDILSKDKVKVKVGLEYRDRKWQVNLLYKSPDDQGKLTLASI